jgi:hypothetical protein
MSPILQRERAEDTSKFLDWIRDALNEEELHHLGVELLDATRGRIDFDDVIVPWAFTAIARQHPEFRPQLKEYANLISSGELFTGVELTTPAQPV